MGASLAMDMQDKNQRNQESRKTGNKISIVGQAHRLPLQLVGQSLALSAVEWAHRLPLERGQAEAPALQFEPDAIWPLGPLFAQFCPHRVLTDVLPFLFRRFRNRQ